MKALKFGNVVACEYIAMGAFGKHTLVNTYSGDIMVKEFPATFPLAFYIEIVPDPEAPNLIKFEVMQGRDIKGVAGAELEYEPGKSGLIALPQLLFVIEREAEIKVIASCEGYKRKVILKKRIFHGLIPGT